MFSGVGSDHSGNCATIYLMFIALPGTTKWEVYTSDEPTKQHYFQWAVVVAELVELLLLTPEVHNSNLKICLLLTVLKRRK